MGSGHDLRKLRWICRPATLPADSAAGAALLKGLDGRAAELADKCAIVFGLGAVGGICFAELARLGVGRLYGVDIDQYGEDSWQTQPMRRIEDADAYKAVVQARIASEANPACTVTTAIGFAQDMPLHLLCRADVLVVAGDNLELAVWAGNMGAALGVPVLVGAVEGHTWLAACRGFDLTDPEAACPGCTLSDGEWKTLTSRAGCDPHTLRVQGIEPTRTLPCICGAAAMMTSAQAVMTLLGMDERLRGEEAAALSPFAKELSHALRPQSKLSLPASAVDLGPRAGASLGVDVVQTHGSAGGNGHGSACPGESAPVQVRGERCWSSFTRCSGCGQIVPVRRFAAAGDELARCRCGRQLLASPLGISSVLPQEDLCHCLDIPLSELGIVPGGAIGIAQGHDPWCFFICGSPPPLESCDDHRPQ